MIKIATIISVYSNDDPFLFEEALVSIFNQNLNLDYTSRVYLVIDGSIPDYLNSVVLKYSTKLYKLFYLEGKNGLAVALNFLISKLEDEDYIFRMDSDDWSFPDRYQIQLNFLGSHTDIDIVGTDILEINKRKNISRQISFPADKMDARNSIYWRVPVAHPTVCFRRKVLDHIGGYPLSGTNEDIALWFQCLYCGFNFANINLPLLKFTLSEDFFRRRSRNKAFSEFAVYVRGIWQLDKLTWKFIFPFFRLVFRLSPVWLLKLGYSLRVGLFKYDS